MDHAALTLTDVTFSEAISNHKGIALVDFWADWCTPCKVMGPEIEKLAAHYAGNTAVKVGKLDVDANGATAQEYGILSLPSFSIFVNGEEVDRVVGVVPVSKLQEKLEGALAQLATA